MNEVSREKKELLPVSYLRKLKAKVPLHLGKEN